MENMANPLTIRKRTLCSTAPETAWSEIYRRSLPCESNWTFAVKSGKRWSKVYDKSWCFSGNQHATKTESFSRPIVEPRLNMMEQKQAEQPGKAGHRETAFKQRDGWSKIYDKSFDFMHWIEPDRSSLLDKVSGVPLSHITLLCKNMICVACPCLKCGSSLERAPGGFFAMGGTFLNKNYKITPSGSNPEGCPLPPYWVKNHETGEDVLKLSDIDMMLPIDTGMASVGFDRRDGSGIVATIETTHTYPGYLRLRGYDGNYIQSAYGKLGNNIWGKESHSALTEMFINLHNYTVKQHSPAITLSRKSSIRPSFSPIKTWFGTTLVLHGRRKPTLG